MKHNFSIRGDGSVYLYIQGVEYPCGYYNHNGTAFIANSYIFPPGHGESTERFNASFEKKEEAEHFLLSSARSNLKKYYPELLSD